MDRASNARLWIGDTFISCFLLFPTMVLYWRGIWDLVGVYIFPDNELKQCWAVVGLGSATIFGYALHPIMDATFRKTSRRWRLILVRVYMAVYAVLPMAYWRGVWTTADYYLGQYGWQGALLEYVVCEIVLLVGRVRQTAIFPPLFVSLDTHDDVLLPSTRFKNKPSVKWQYVGDAIFSHFYALTFTILLWRGAWVTMDACLAHYDYLWSHVASLVVGYVATLTMLFLDPLFLYFHRLISKRHATSSPRRRLLAILSWEAVVYILAFWAHFFLWRGAWILNTIYVIEDLELGGWVNHIVGSLLFLVLQVYSYVGACGCVVDGCINDDNDRFFPTHYIAHMLPHLKCQKKSSSAMKPNFVRETTSSRPLQECEDSGDNSNQEDSDKSGQDSQVSMTNRHGSSENISSA